MTLSPVRLADISLRALGRQGPPAAHWAVSAAALAALDRAGFATIDAWGGLTIGRCLRSLDETPWERLRDLKRHVTETPLQMELRGRCLVGSRPYPPEVVRAFVHEAAACGVDSFLVYEPLNDPTGLEAVASAVRDTGARLVLGLAVDSADEEDLVSYTTVLKRLAAMEPAAVCLNIIGALVPSALGKVVERAVAVTASPIEVALEDQAGFGGAGARACVQSGASLIYGSVAPKWADPSALSLSSLITLLEDSEGAVEIDKEAVAVAQVLLGQTLFDGGPFDGEQTCVRETALVDQGRLRLLPLDVVEQAAGRLRALGAGRRLPEVVGEMLRIKGELGGPPLLAPIGQMIATQAVLNVLYSRRWQVVPDEMKRYLRGEYGAPPRSPEKELVDSVLESGGDDRAAGSVEPALGGDRAPERDRGEWLLRVMAPAAASVFFDRRAVAEDVDGLFEPPESADSLNGVEERWAELGPERIRDLVGLLEDSSVEELTIEDQGVRVSLRKGNTAGAGVAPQAAAGIPDMAGETADEPSGDGRVVVPASMVGTFYRSPAPGTPPFVEVGSRVEEGDPLCVLEAMKLMNEQLAEFAGEITAVLVEDGVAVEYGQPLFYVQPDED